MELLTYRHLWGVTEPLEAALARIGAEGYTGVEHELPEPADADRFKELLSAAGLDFIPQLHTEGDSPEEHEASLVRSLRRAAEFEPRLVVCQAGADAWPYDVSRAFLERAVAIEADVGIPVAHETHRSRILFTPWQARDLMLELPELKLCCDYSHWVVVAERLLDDERDVLRLCAERCLHVHARVGYAQGPQVPDPSAPEYREQLLAHERWWDEIWDAQARRGLAVTTLTPEYGPPDYLHTLPHTDAPVADLWAVSLWQAERERGRFAERARAQGTPHQSTSSRA
jgi:hypothetical protein